jgi:hypothetical protein
VVEWFLRLLSGFCWCHWNSVFPWMSEWKAQTTGLQIFYRDNEEVRTLIRRAAVLPPIPLDRMEDVWFQALEDLEDADIPHSTHTSWHVVEWFLRLLSGFCWCHWNSVFPWMSEWWWIYLDMSAEPSSSAYHAMPRCCANYVICLSCIKLIFQRIKNICQVTVLRHYILLIMSYVLFAYL